MFPWQRIVFNRGGFLAATVSIALGFVALPLAAQTADSCPDYRWSGFTNPGPQEFKVVDAYPTSLGREVHEVLFGPLEGKYAKAYLFAEFEGDCLMRVVSIGSYALTAMGLDGEGSTGDDRLYHADLYEPNSHATLGFYEGKPNLDEMRALAMSVFSEQPVEPVSKTELPNGTGE